MMVSVTDGIDSSTAAGTMMIGVLGSLAERYARSVSALTVSRMCRVFPGRSWGSTGRLGAIPFPTIPEICAGYRIADRYVDDPGENQAESYRRPNRARSRHCVAAWTPDS